MKWLSLAVVALMVGVFTFVPVDITCAGDTGLVPCGGEPGDECQLCRLVDLLNNIASWLVVVLSVVVAIVIVVSGIRLVSSAGNQAEMQAAKSMITNVIIGYIIVLAAWLIVDFGMKVLFGGEEPELGPWNSIECVTQPSARIFHPVDDASRGTPTETVMLADGTVVPLAAADGTLDPVAIARLAELSAPDDNVAAAAAAQGLTPAQARNMQALMRVESAGCRNVVSPVGALGCMQIMPATARSYDPSLRNLSDTELRNRLLDDNAYNISLSARIYRDLVERYDGNEVLVHAAYNGGPGANNPSVNCPGQRRWQCEWDGSDCINGVGSDCTPNTGYIETRNYVQKVNAVAEQLD